MTPLWDISEIANILRSCNSEIYNGKKKLCLSANYLSKLNSALEDIDSFSTASINNSKTNRMRDEQFLLELFERTIHLKINPDIISDFTFLDIKKFKNLKTLEVYKINIRLIIGIQKLRSQLQELTLCYSTNALTEILDKCGGDNSQRYSWRELKIANFSHNELVEIDDSIECALSLHTLDLSHNNLSHVDFLNQLPNLKYLNLSYNKLTSVPNFKGQICNRLQVCI